MLKTLYFNIEDDLRKVVTRLKREQADRVVLVFPKQSYLFADGVNLKMLKKQTDLLGIDAAILTMDERGQVYAKDAGFELRQLPTANRNSGMGDIKAARPEATGQEVVMPRLEDGEEPKTISVRKAQVKTVKSPSKHVVPNVQIQDTIFPDLGLASSKNSHIRLPKNKRRKRIIIGSVAAALLLIVLLTTLVLPSATIIVYAKTEPVARDIELSMTTETREPNATKLIMPASVVEKTVALSEKFTSTGKKEVGSKAGGRVRIFSLAKLPLNLKADTTTLTYVKTDRRYVFTSDVNSVKPISQDKLSDPNAGHLADIVATEGGETFNIPSGARLEITNQVFGSQPQFLYAVTEGEMTGGNSRFLSVVSEGDVQAAQKSLTDSFMEQIQTELRGQGLIMPDKAYTLETTAFTTDKPTGTESPNFSASATLRVKGLAFKGEVLNALLRDRISELLPSNKHLQSSEHDSVTYRLKTIDIPAGQASLMAHFESNAVFKLDLAGLASGITGKSKEQASELLLSKSEVNRVDIVLSPAWQNTLPRLTAKIKIEERKQ